MSRELIDGALNYVADHAWKGIDAAINISSYTNESNYYTIPSDGMVRLRANIGHFLQGKVANADGSNAALFSTQGYGSASGSIAIPVFKGQRAWISARSSAAETELQFIPYVSMMVQAN